MANHERAGQPAQQSDLINVAQLTSQYYVLKPEVGNAEHAVKFGTSGHRGGARATALTNRIFWPLLRPSLKNAPKTVLPVRASSVKTPTRCPNRPSFPCWKCWQRMVWMS